MANATYHTTRDGAIVRRSWLTAGGMAFISALRPGGAVPMLLGIIDFLPEGGYRVTGMLRALNTEKHLGDVQDFAEAEELLLQHRSGRRTCEKWAPPSGVERRAHALQVLADRRRIHAGEAFSIADLIDDLAAAS